jgi:hypothetical protein
MEYFFYHLLATIYHVNLQDVIESYFIGTLIGLSIYYFTKNKWGSVFISLPISSIYLHLVYNDILNYFYMFIGLFVHYIIISIIDRKLIKKLNKSKK